MSQMTAKLTTITEESGLMGIMSGRLRKNV